MPIRQTAVEKHERFILTWAQTYVPGLRHDATLVGTLTELLREHAALAAVMGAEQATTTERAA